MRYISTRGAAPELDFDEVLLAGLARDGGLYVPREWPRFSDQEIREMRGLGYADLAVRIMRPFIGRSISDAELSTLVHAAYAGFGHPAVAPLKQLDGGHWMMELFHGPTLAFKDYAMQILSRLFDNALQRRGERVTIVGATSGDTGSAAIEACQGRDAVDIFILFPKGRVSPVQQRQMTTLDAANVHAISLEGTFDDCQDMVKALFNDLAFRDRYRLSAVNSINWARLLPQIVYYFWAGLALGAPDRKVAFSVPSGNFGNVFSGYAAQALGLPIETLVVATNANDILSRFFNSGTMEIRGVKPSLSPSMDIQVSSNFERLLFDLHDRDGVATARVLEGFRESGGFSASQGMLDRVNTLFGATAVDDAATTARIRSTFAATGEILDPHSAIGIEAAVRMRKAKTLSSDVPVVSIATAHPSKFPDAVVDAIGTRPALPPRMADLMDREEHFTVLANDFATVSDYIANRTHAGGPTA
ncbi:MAG: threonine synthase [Alphaproteobacteria bacterium]|nr:threonine synthase [Alphaproteobacteria bacterium]